MIGSTEVLEYNVFITDEHVRVCS